MAEIQLKNLTPEASNDWSGEALEKNLEEMRLGITFKYIYPGLLKTIFVPPQKRLQIIIYPVRNNAPLEFLTGFTSVSFNLIPVTFIG